TTGMAATTVHELSGGGLILGQGTGPAAPGALRRLRELVVALRRAFSGEVAETSDGERFRLDLRPPEPPPIWIAALGPAAARLAGEVADGVLLNWCPPERVAWARERIREGAGRARPVGGDGCRLRAGLCGPGPRGVGARARPRRRPIRVVPGVSATVRGRRSGGRGAGRRGGVRGGTPGGRPQGDRPPVLPAGPGERVL